jgi:hypothetical protein
MRIPEASWPGTRLTRGARWLGLDRNPLRRPTDRIEGAVRLATVLLFLIALPLACIAVAQLTAHMSQQQAHAQQAADHKVTATLLEGAPAASAPDPYSAVQMTMVPARWQPPGQTPRLGQVLAPAGAPAGSSETIWVDASGRVTTAPDSGLVDAAVAVAVVNTCLGAGLVLLLANVLARHALHRRRMSDWDAEWQATGPLWSGRR